MTPFDWHKKRLKANMPHVAETMLDFLKRVGPMKITDFIAEIEKHSLGSRAHLYFNLSWLRTNNYVKEFSPVNNLRIKEISVSSKGMKYLESE